jgi:hypothetical protein
MFRSTIRYGRVHRGKWRTSRTFTVAVLSCHQQTQAETAHYVYCRRHEGILTFLTKLEQTKPDMDEKVHF